MQCPSLHHDEFDPHDRPCSGRKPTLLAVIAWIVTNGLAVAAAIVSALLMTG